MEARPLRVLSEDEYLTIEESNGALSDYVNGEAFECAGASEAHNLVVTNLAGRLSALLAERPCVVLSSQQRIATVATRAFHHPDLTVVCGAIERHPKDRNTITNPTLVVEVLSPSTADYDRGAKFDHYRSMASLGEVLFVAPEARTIEQRRRLPSGEWVVRWFSEGSIELAAIGATLEVHVAFTKLELLG